jgi:CRISPR-associated protein Cmr2
MTEGGMSRVAGVDGASAVGGSAVGGDAVDADLVVVTLPGVQRFIAESQSTADLYAGSALMSELAVAMVRAVPADDVVLPPRAGGTGTPNRVVALAPANRGRELALRMVEAVHRAWRAYDSAEDTIGFPAVQSVVVSPMRGAYPAQWKRAGRALAARKRIRDFTFEPVAQTRVCSPPREVWA